MSFVDATQPTGAPPAFLPLRQAASGGSSAPFVESLRAQIRSQVTQVLAQQIPGSGQTLINGVRAQTLQQALQPAFSTGASGVPQVYTGTQTATGPWADVARGIGAHYLSPQDAAIFARQMALESGNFDPDVIAGRKVSAAGAQGIAQLMPSSYPNVNRLDPIASLNAAAGTMRDNLRLYNGDMRKALAAYNAGTATVNGLVSRLGANWEQGLPQETRRYLQALLGSAPAG
jgi:soluble lytic murein transglycosylase-like protein